MSLAIGLVLLATFLMLVAFVTWIFVERIRRKEPPVRSFFRWLGDLVDLLFGIG